MTIEANVWNKNSSAWRELVDSSTIQIDVSTPEKASLNVTAVPADSVGNTQLADMAAYTIKMRNAGTSGDPQDQALANLTTQVTASSSGYVLGFLNTGDIRVYTIGSLAPTVVDRQTFNSNGTWTKPSTGTVALIQAWGAGGSGGRAGSADGGGGGGGGAYSEHIFVLASLSASVSVTIGGGGASRTSDNTDGAGGGDTTFGAYITAYGGGGGSGNGTQNGGGGGGGQTSAGSSSAASINGANGGTPRHVFAVTAGALEVTMTLGTGSTVTSRLGGSNMAGGGGGGIGGNGAAGTAGGQGHFGGGGGGGGSEASGAAAAGGASIHGGGGGGGGSSTTAAAAGGTSLWGGNGGAGNFDANNATGGTQPGGAGGGSETGNSGAGGDGRVIVTVW
jgi:hypothetical protein